MEGKLAGVYIPSQVSSYLSLYVLANRMTKSIILRDLIDEWYRDKRVSCPEDDLISKIITNSVNSWKIRKSMLNHLADFDEFLSELAKELEKKGIVSYYIELILKKVQNEENKEANLPE